MEFIRVIVDFLLSSIGQDALAPIRPLLTLDIDTSPPEEVVKICPDWLELAKISWSSSLVLEPLARVYPPVLPDRLDTIEVLPRPWSPVSPLDTQRVGLLQMDTDLLVVIVVGRGAVSSTMYKVNTIFTGFCCVLPFCI